MFGPEGLLEACCSDMDIPSPSEWMKSMDPMTGLVVRACAEIVLAKERLETNGVRLQISAQFVEIYNEQVFLGIE